MIIPPEDVDVDQREWRAIYQLKQDIESDVLDSDRVRSSLETGDVDDLIEEELTFTPPADVRETLTRAIDHLADGDRDECTRLLNEHFQSPCETGEPMMHEADRQHVLCHLYDPSLPGEPADLQSLEESGR